MRELQTVNVLVYLNEAPISGATGYETGRLNTRCQLNFSKQLGISRLQDT